MPQYAYRVRDASGRLLKGTMEADGEARVIKYLRSQNYYIIDIRRLTALEWEFKLPSLRRRRVKLRDLAVFCRQFSTMINAGLPIMLSLKTLSQQIDNRVLRDTLKGLIEELEKGQSLHESVQQFPQVFPPIFVNMIEAGEISGALDEVLERLADHLEREHQMNEKVRTALTYPTVILVVAVLAVVFLLTFVLPTFTAMLESLNAPLPLPTRIIINASRFLRGYWYYILGGLVLTVLGIRRMLQEETVAREVDRYLLRVPVFGQLIHKSILSRFSRTLGTLLRSGVPVVEALEVVRRTTGNRVVAEGVQKAVESIREGQSIAERLAETGVFPPMVIEMVAIGEETGNLDALLEKISLFYDREVESVVSRLSSMIEPILIAVLGGFVAFIIVSVLLPIFNIMGAM